MTSTEPHPRPPLALSPPGALALLAFDGDDMGRQVQADPDRTPGALARFAAAAAGLLKKHEGDAFYLAGDEGLAMAPAEMALDLAVALREAFTAAFADLEARRPTLSLGLAFFEQGRGPRARNARKEAGGQQNVESGGFEREGEGGGESRLFVVKRC